MPISKLILVCTDLALTKKMSRALLLFFVKNIKVCGIYTHLCASDSIDEKDVSFTNMQIESFYKLLRLIKEKV